MAITKEFIEQCAKEAQKNVEADSFEVTRATANFNYHRGELSAYRRMLMFFEPLDKGVVNNN